MTRASGLMKSLGLEHPIVQAPMAGGGDTPRLVAAVSEAGALGSIGAAYLTPRQIAESAQAVRSLTSRRFGINLFAPVRVPEGVADARRAIERVAPHYAELGLAAPAPPTGPADSFPAQLAAALESGASVFSFTFGMLPAAAVEAVKRRGMFLAGTATTVEEAIALKKAGVDPVIAQGSEAGGHRGSFAGDFEASMVGTIALVPQIADVVRIPVIASGGIMDGRGIAAALALGASAVQLGTAFLTTDEAGVPDSYKQAILGAQEHQTRLTRAFSGRPARGILPGAKAPTLRELCRRGDMLDPRHSPTIADASQAADAELDALPAQSEHTVQFYEEEAFLHETVARYLGAGLIANEPIVVI